MILIAVLVVKIAEMLLALVGSVLLAVILCQDVYPPPPTTAELVRAMEIHVIVIK
jgi:hypothetical protein